MSSSRYVEERNNTVQALLLELRHCILGPVTNAAPGYAVKKAEAHALNDRLNLDSNDKADTQTREVASKFEGVLDKLRVSGGRNQLVETLNEYKERFFRCNRLVNPNPVKHMTEKDLTAHKILKMLLQLSHSPTKPSAESEAFMQALCASSARVLDDASAAATDAEACSEGETGDGLDEWQDEYRRPQNNAEEWDSEAEDEDDEESGGSLASESGRGDEDEEVDAMPQPSAAVSANTSRAGWRAQENLLYGAHLSHFTVSPQALYTEFGDRFLHAKGIPTVLVCSEFDACKLVIEMLLGSPNDLFDRKDVAWDAVFGAGVHHRRGGPVVEPVPDLATDCRSFEPSHHARNMRIPNIGPTVFKGILRWFAELGSDMHTCRRFGSFYEVYESGRARSADLPLKKLLEGLRSQVLEHVTHLTNELTEFQHVLMHEGVTGAGSESQEPSSIGGADGDGGVTMHFEMLIPAKPRCSLIRLYHNARKWRGVLSSVVSFVQTVLNFRQFQQHGIANLVGGSGGRSSKRSSSRSEDEQRYEFIMTYQMLNCLQEGVRAGSFDVANNPHSLFRKDHANASVGQSFAMRRSRYVDPSLVGIVESPPRWGYPIFERLAFTHFVHYFVEICCQSLAFVREQNYILKASDVFNKSKATFLCSRQGGLMKMALPYLALLDAHYLQENKSISRYSKMNAAGKVSWMEQIKNIKCLADYNTGSNDKDSYVPKDNSHFLEQLGRDLASLDSSDKYSKMDSFGYISDYLKTIRVTTEQEVVHNSDQLKHQIATQTLSEAYLLNILPTPKLHELLLMNPIMEARRDVQVAVVEGIWEHFSLDQYFHFLRSVFLMGNDDLFVPFEEQVTEVLGLSNRSVRLKSQTSKLATNLQQSFGALMKAIIPSVGVVHSSVSLDERKLVPAHISSGALFLSQVVDGLSIEMHLAYPLGEIFTDTIMTRYNNTLKFVLRLTVCEWALKAAWREGATNRYNAERIENTQLVSALRKAGKDDNLCTYATNARRWCSYMRKTRLAMGLVLRVCADIRAYYLQVLHSQLWMQFQNVLCYAPADAAAYDYDGPISIKLQQQLNLQQQKLKLKSIGEIRDCHGCLLVNISQRIDQFGDVLKSLLYSFTQFAEAVVDATKEEEEVVRYLQVPEQVEYVQLERFEKAIEEHRSRVLNLLQQSEDVLKLFRTQLDQVVRIETLSHVFDGFRKLRDMLQ